jgi:ATP-dependent helicase Lhr and Lhr-like helicase
VSRDTRATADSAARAPLDGFLAPVREWFCEALGEPTAAQRQGWPSIQARQNTLILAPTGSGKTLAAFLACLDTLWRQDPLPPGVRLADDALERLRQRQLRRTDRLDDDEE